MTQTHLQEYEVQEKPGLYAPVADKVFWILQQSQDAVNTTSALLDLYAHEYGSTFKQEEEILRTRRDLVNTKKLFKPDPEYLCSNLKKYYEMVEKYGKGHN